MSTEGKTNLWLMASKSHRFCKGRKRVHVLYIERKKNLVLDTARRRGGGKRIVMTNLRFLPNIKTRDEAKNIVVFTGEN